MQTKRDYANSYKTMMTIGYAFAIVACVGCGLLFLSFLFQTLGGYYYTEDGIILMVCAIIPFAWAIPMTLRMNNKRRASEPSKCLALGICSIIFLGLVSGIFVTIAHTYYNKWQTAPPDFGNFSQVNVDIESKD
ncbi:hypothetical protein [Mesoplasma lactucae]|uniref:Uncharacterized protein n=1 Tax=Mesoplasma lactucae ATCC 49193 TaxID=81460 RepID=A0A291IRN6_9MOLU|nr:hypothetical protein [Mesoplasma lactucae]ATG97376.1 hypothetical protein CP520_01210 [Mesoplasma lactucae ATCC 49193]ATZ20172.1 hypothetical protein MLACT_v1c03510 [Mesoplasma lactucae ATCC 49193]MCL8216921.1 hypothetical protein [Mesoplasma lactucae ATCC 49193]